MGRRKKQAQGCEYSKLNPNAAEFIPAVVSTCEGKYSADELARYRKGIPKSSRPAPYLNNNNEKLSFSFLGLESDTEEENPGVDFVSEMPMPTLVLERIFQLLDVTSIQNCRKVCYNWNNAIFDLKSSVSVIRDLESDAAFLEKLEKARVLWDFPEIPWYLDYSCATCHVYEYPANKMVKRRDTVGALLFDVYFLLAYKLDGEEKLHEINENKGFFQECPDSETNDVKERMIDRAFKRGVRLDEKSLFRKNRKREKYFVYAILKRVKMVKQFLLNQNLIPLLKCENECNKIHPWLYIFTEELLEHAGHIPCLRFYEAFF